MNNRYKYLIVLAVTALIAGCTSPSETGSVKTEREPESIVIENTIEKPAVKAEDSSEEENTNPVTTKANNKGGLYDTSYLEEDEGGFTYRLSDQSIKDKYDELYSAAFVDLIDSYNRVTGIDNQSFDFNQPLALNNLVMDNMEYGIFTNTGSFYEEDYGFNLDNVGYTYVDLNSDGVFELIFGVLNEAANPYWVPLNFFERAYTLVGDKPVKICEGGNRDLFWLGSDGHIYETGSGGAAHGGTWRLHFDSSQVGPEENVSWGSIGFVQDEFLGYWEAPVHIDGPITDIDELAKLPENQISDGELDILQKEWNDRQVCIEWLRFREQL